MKAFDTREQQLKGEIEQQLAEDHRKELEAKEQAYKKICQELEGVQKDLRLVQEQVEAAKRLANQEHQRAEESAQTLAAYEGKLVTLVEKRQKLPQANATM